MQYKKNEIDSAFLPPESSVNDVILEIESWKIENNPDIFSAHSALIKENDRSYQIALCYEIINRETGELHHHEVEIFNVHRYSKKGYVLKDRYRITDLKHLLAVHEFLSIIKENEIGSDTQKRILINEQDYLKFEKLSEKCKLDFINSIFSEVDGIENIIKYGGSDFLKKLIKWFVDNQNIEGVTEKFQEILDVIGEMKGEERVKILNAIKKQNLSKEDIDILSGRKDGLLEFENQILENWTEPLWQDFFQRNTWIFGYGLDYRFLKILQKEAHISDVDLQGKNAVIGDFLAGCNNFTVLIELKKPNTSLFRQSQNRSDSWKLSSELIDSVSQILTQKANWLIKGNVENYNDNGELIIQKTIDPKTILVIGHTNQFGGNNKESKIKMKTFELFRRNLRNIEILTYDELLERARFIVKPVSF